MAAERVEGGPRAAASGMAVSRPYPIQLRFSDTDRLGHVNNAVFATYAELGRLAFLRELGMTDQGLILARLAIDFLRQVRLGTSATSSRGSCGSGTRASRWSRR